MEELYLIRNIKSLNSDITSINSNISTINNGMTSISSNISTINTELDELKNSSSTSETGETIDMYTSNLQFIEPVLSNRFVADIVSATNEDNISTKLKGTTYTVPNNWVYSDGLTVDEDINALNFKAGQYAYANFSSIFPGVYSIRVAFKITAQNSKFGIMTYASGSGSIYTIDDAAHTINIHQKYDPMHTMSTVPSIVVSTTIPTLTIGKEYIMEIARDNCKYKATLIDPETSQKYTVSYDCSPLNTSIKPGCGWGSPGVICLDGSVTFKYLNYGIANFKHMKVQIAGDSITEGFNCVEDNIDAWSRQVVTKIFKGKGLCCGRSGGNAINVYNHLTEMYQLGMKLETLVVLIGTNESANDYGTSIWEVNVNKIVELAKSNGTRCIICVPPFKPAATNPVEWITGFSRRILYNSWETIRFDLATTENRDGETEIYQTYYDGTHPRGKGSSLMFNEAKTVLENL